MKIFLKIKEKINIRTVTAGVFALFLSLLFLAFWILPDRDFSENENRSLQTFPRFSWERLSSGKFSEEMNDYFADQFPLRDLWVSVKSVFELGRGAGENDGILLGKDGQLARRLFDVRRANGEILKDQDGYDTEALERAMTGIKTANEGLEVPFTVLLTGRSVDIAAASFPYPDEWSERLTDAVSATLLGTVETVETIPLLREKYEAGEYVWYRTDHHWTTLGAYYAYVEIMKQWGMEDSVLPMTAFTRETVSENFRGSAWSASGMRFAGADSIELWLSGNEDSFTVTADGERLENGLYNRSYLAGKDQYSVFLDGTHNVVTVEKEGEERPKLLLIKDSFANSLAPFLAEHFDLILLNLSATREDYTAVSSLAGEYGADRVLLVYTLENVLTADKLAKLN